MLTRCVHSVTAVAVVVAVAVAVVEVGVVLQPTVAVAVIRTVLAGGTAAGGIADGIRNEIDFTLSRRRRASLKR